jgi:hypothetical protein
MGQTLCDIGKWLLTAAFITCFLLGNIYGVWRWRRERNGQDSGGAALLAWLRQKLLRALDRG